MDNGLKPLAPLAVPGPANDVEAPSTPVSYDRPRRSVALRRRPADAFCLPLNMASDGDKFDDFCRKREWVASLTPRRLGEISTTWLRDTRRELPDLPDDLADVLALDPEPPPLPSMAARRLHPFAFLGTCTSQHWDMLTEQLTAVRHHAVQENEVDALGPSTAAEAGLRILGRLDRTTNSAEQRALEEQLPEEQTDILIYLAVLGMYHRYQIEEKQLGHLWEAYLHLAKHTAAPPQRQAQTYAAEWFSEWQRVLAMLQRRLGRLSQLVEQLGRAHAMVTGRPARYPFWVLDLWAAPTRHVPVKDGAQRRQMLENYNMAHDLALRCRVHLQHQLCVWRDSVAQARA